MTERSLSDSGARWSSWHPTVASFFAGPESPIFPGSTVRDGALRYESWINGLSTHEALVRDLFVECPIPHPTFLLRADVVDLVGGYRDRGWPEDYDLVLRLWEGGGRFGKVPEPLLRWREGEDRLSRSHPAYSAEAFRRCKVHFLLRTHLRNGRGVMVWGAGPVGKAFARELIAQGGRLLAFVDLDPRKVGQEIYGVQVIPPAAALRIPGAFSLAAVGKKGGRGEIRETSEGRPAGGVHRTSWRWPEPRFRSSKNACFSLFFKHFRVITSLGPPGLNPGSARRQAA